MKTLLFIFSTLLAAPALACEPVAMTIEDNIKAAEVIFAGRVVEVKPPADITFEVIRSWKGSVTKRLMVRTVDNTCGISGVTPGDEMMIFAKGNPLMTTSVDGDYIMKTSGGRVVNDAAAIEKQLGAGKVPE